MEVWCFVAVAYLYCFRSNTVNNLHCKNTLFYREKQINLGEGDKM